MKRLPPLPTGTDLGLFALVAIGSALLASLIQAHDLAMAVFALPIFVFAAWTGMRRSGQWGAISQKVEVEVTSQESEVGS